MPETAARLALVARRNEIARFTIAVTGIDLTGVAMAMQVRLARGVPGTPLIQLGTVTTLAAEGLKLDSVSTVNGLPVSVIKGRINQATMADATKVPFAGELGADTVLAYAMQWTQNGDTNTRIEGSLIVRDTAFGPDNFPANRPSGYGGSSASGADSASLTFGDQIVQVSLRDADLLAPLVTAATAASTTAIDRASVAAVQAGLAQQALAAIVNAAAFPVGRLFATYALASAGAAALADNAFVQVLADETKQGTTSIYQKMGARLAYLLSLANTFDARPVPTGVFFDTGAGDQFTALSYPSNASLTVTPASIVFSSASEVALDVMLKTPSGAVLKTCLDYYDLDLTMTLPTDAFPVAGEGIPTRGVMLTMLNEVLGVYGAGVAAGGNTGSIYPRHMLAGSIGARYVEPAQPFNGAPVQMRVRFSREGANSRVTINYNGGADISVVQAMTYSSSSTSEFPRAFSSVGIRFGQAKATVTALKASARFPGARFAFMGDSIVQGRFATAYANGFAQKVRATQAPRQTLIAGAPGSTTGDWSTRLYDVIKMAPRYLFLLLGTNDVTTGVAQATYQTNMTALVSALQAADITVVVLTVPPNGNSKTPTWNTWTKAQGWPVIDIYPLLVGTGTSLATNYDSGDTIHPNDAGFAVMAQAVNSYIAAQGW